MARILTRLQEKFKPDFNRVVQDYDDFLRHSLVTTKSFQDIVDKVHNPKQSLKQLVFLVYALVYFLPKYLCLCSLYFQDENIRVRYQYLLADYNEELGLFGRTFNICSIVFSSGMVFNIFVMKKFEGSASLQFMTDWVLRVPKKDTKDTKETFDNYLDNESRYELLTQLHYKMLLAKSLARGIKLATQTQNVIACSLFLYRQNPSIWVTSLALFNCLTLTYCLELSGDLYNSLYLSFVFTTDYFRCRISKLFKKIHELHTQQLTKESLTNILDDYDHMVHDFNKYNKSLRHLLRNMVYFYAVALTACFFMLTIETETWILVIIVMSGGGYSLTILATGVYVSQLHSQTIELHAKLSALCAIHSREAGLIGSLKNLFRLRLTIKELGSLETNGQFVVGLRDGDGAATSRMQIFELTLATISNTLMMIEFMNQN